MNRIKKTPSKRAKAWVSLHDKNITKVKIYNNSLFFYFEEGFDFINNEELIRTKEGVVKFDNYEDLVVDCYILKTRYSIEGLFFKGEPIDIESLNNYIQKRKLTLEVFRERYYEDEILWVAALRSQKGYVSNKRVVIRILDCKTMIFLWEQ